MLSYLAIDQKATNFYFSLFGMDTKNKQNNSNVDPCSCLSRIAVVYISADVVCAGTPDRDGAGRDLCARCDHQHPFFTVVWVDLFTDICQHALSYLCGLNGALAACGSGDPGGLEALSRNKAIDLTLNRCLSLFFSVNFICTYEIRCILPQKRPGNKSNVVDNGSGVYGEQSKSEGMVKAAGQGKRARVQEGQEGTR